MSAELIALTCPYCGAAVTADLVSSDSGEILISCDRRACGAEWLASGAPLHGSNWTGPRP